MWRTAWEFWTTESNLASMPEDVAAFGRKTLPLIHNRLDLVEPETEFLPGFEIIPAVGHRRDHITLLISSAGEQLLHLADTVIHPMMLASLGWYSPYDSLPEPAIAAKRRLLDRAAAEKTLVFSWSGLC
jgi:glyoxylase-like metal-dependent hydrolase (beta-lactamase superfamily II)